MSNKNNKFTQLKEFHKLSDENMQFLINKAYQILENPIIIYDLNWKIIAYAEGVVTDDPIWNSHVNHGTINFEIKNLALDEGFVEIMASQKPVVFLHSDILKYGRIFAKLFDENGIVIAFASVVASDKQFEDHDVILVEEICKKLSKEILKVDYYKNSGRMKLEFLIKNLIEGDGLIDLYEVNYIEMIYSKFKNYLYIAVADIGLSDPTYSQLEYYKDLFWKLRPSFKYSVYLNYILIIMSTDETVLYPKKFFNRLSGLFKQKNIKVGLSSQFENLFNLKKHYEEALKALTDGLQSNSKDHIFVYTDIE